MSSFKSVCDEIEIVNRIYAEHSTFGHLYPEKNKTYKGSFIVVRGCFGQTDIFDFKFEGLCSSPQFYEDINRAAFDIDLDDCEVARFTGTYRNGKFVGKVEKINLSL